jgi:hypothetical protein
MANKITNHPTTKYILYIIGIVILGGLIYFAGRESGRRSLSSKFAEIFPTSTAITIEEAAGNQAAAEAEAPNSSEIQALAPGAATITPTIQAGTRAPANSAPTSSNPASSNPTSPASNNPNPTSPPAPTSSIPTSAAPTSSVPTATKTEAPAGVGPGVPGITMAQAEQKLVTDRGFRCTSTVKPDLVALTCDYKALVDKDRVTYNVQVYGRDTTSILFMYSTVIQDKPDKNAAVEILGYIAALPFKDQPQLATEARAWVASELPAIQNANENRQNTIGGIKYRLYGSSKAWFLEMGDQLLVD